MDSLHLPTLNAILNAIAATLLVCGRIAIAKGRVHNHRGFMTAALVVSAAFLTSYLIHHAQHGSTPYGGSGFMRVVYYLVLWPHVLLAAIQVPFIVLAVVHAARGHYAKHVRIVRWLWPVWMYVSVTGVLVYLMLYRF